MTRIVSLYAYQEKKRIGTLYRKNQQVDNDVYNWLLMVLQLRIKDVNVSCKQFCCFHEWRRPLPYQITIPNRNKGPLLSITTRPQMNFPLYEANVMHNLHANQMMAHFLLRGPRLMAIFIGSCQCPHTDMCLCIYKHISVYKICME